MSKGSVSDGFFRRRLPRRAEPLVQVAVRLEQAMVEQEQLTPGSTYRVEGRHGTMQRATLPAVCVVFPSECVELGGQEKGHLPVYENDGLLLAVSIKDALAIEYLQLRDFVDGPMYNVAVVRWVSREETRHFWEGARYAFRVNPHCPSLDCWDWRDYLRGPRRAHRRP